MYADTQAASEYAEGWEDEVWWTACQDKALRPLAPTTSTTTSGFIQIKAICQQNMSHGSYGEFHPNSSAYWRLNTHQIPTIAQAQQHRHERHLLSLFCSFRFIQSLHLQFWVCLGNKEPNAKSSCHLWRLSSQSHCAEVMSCSASSHPLTQFHSTRYSIQ